MSNAYSDDTAAKLRGIVSTIDREIAQTPPSGALTAAWSELVLALALGPAPEMRECPVCHGMGRRAASRCSNCWSALEVLPPLTENEKRGDA